MGGVLNRNEERVGDEDDAVFWLDGWGNEPFWDNVGRRHNVYMTWLPARSRSCSRSGLPDT